MNLQGRDPSPNCKFSGWALCPHCDNADSRVSTDSLIGTLQEILTLPPASRCPTGQKTQQGWSTTGSLRIFISDNLSQAWAFLLAIICLSPLKFSILEPNFLQKCSGNHLLFLPKKHPALPKPATVTRVQCCLVTYGYCTFVTSSDLKHSSILFFVIREQSLSLSSRILNWFLMESITWEASFSLSDSASLLASSSLEPLACSPGPPWAPLFVHLEQVKIKVAPLRSMISGIS